MKNDNSQTRFDVTPGQLLWVRDDFAPLYVRSAGLSGDDVMLRKNDPAIVLSIEENPPAFNSIRFINVLTAFGKGKMMSLHFMNGKQ